MAYLDLFGTLLSLTATYLFTRSLKSAWLISLAAICVNFRLYWHKGVYGHAILESFYLLSIMYGIYLWYHPIKAKTHNITHIPNDAIKTLIILSMISIPFMAWSLKHGLDSDVPWWDASTCVLALVAQWMLCKKWIECWIIWFVVDAMMASLNWYKGIPFHSMHHFVYLAFAVLGHVRWVKIHEAKKPLPQVVQYNN